MWSPADVNLSSLCLGATSLLVLSFEVFKNFETWPPATYNNGQILAFLAD